MSFAQVAMVASLLFVSALGSTCNLEIPSVIEYFDNIDKLEEDLSKLKWGHAVNNNDLLQKALKNDSLHMIESDLIDKDNKVYMGHSLSEISDLTFEDFLKNILDYLKENNKTKKGLKLDFKSTKALDLAYETLKKEKAKINFPLWINADIIEGPRGNPAEVKIDYDKMKEVLDCVVMSIGWTTGDWKQPTPKEYTSEMIENMGKVTYGTTKTYPVRAVYVAKSWKNLYETLLKNKERENDTLTIWSPNNDLEDIDTKELSCLIKEHKNRIFVDLPQEIMNKLNEIQCETTTVTPDTSSTTTEGGGGSGTNIFVPFNLLFLLSYTLASFV